MQLMSERMHAPHSSWLHQFMRLRYKIRKSFELKNTIDSNIKTYILTRKFKTILLNKKNILYRVRARKRSCTVHQFMGLIVHTMHAQILNLKLLLIGEVLEASQRMNYNWVTKYWVVFPWTWYCQCYQRQSCFSTELAEFATYLIPIQCSRQEHSQCSKGPR